MIDAIKDKSKLVINFLRNKSLKTKFIKLGITLFLIFLTFLNWDFGYAVLGATALFVALEFSADSIFWVVLVGVTTGYTKLVCLNILIYELVAILTIRLIIDIIHKEIDYKNWRFITLISLFVALSIYLLLPLSINYSFVASIKRIAFFALMVLGVIRIKDINIKHFLILFTTSIISICILFILARKCGLEVWQYPTYSSYGTVERFGVIAFDPNFTGAVLICAISSWFIVYKKEIVDKLTYFTLFAILMCFVLRTISKATILIIALFGIYVVIENIVTTIKTKNPKHLLELVWYLVAIGIACGVCWKYVNAVYQRIVHEDAMWTVGDNMSMSNLTTGRSDIWISYLKKIFGSLQILLFGAGVSAGIFGRPAHSMPIEYLYTYGVLGILIMLAIFVIGAWPYLKKIKAYNFVPMVLITGIFCSIGSDSTKYVYVFSTIFLALSYIDCSNTTSTTIDKEAYKLEADNN